jgi:hypothetical protein
MPVLVTIELIFPLLVVVEKNTLDLATLTFRPERLAKRLRVEATFKAWELVALATRRTSSAKK